MNELLYKLTEKLEAYENGEIDATHLDHVVKASNAMCTVIKTTIAGEQHINQRSAMEFITAGSEQTKKIAEKSGFNVMDIGKR